MHDFFQEKLAAFYTTGQNSLANLIPEALCLILLSTEGKAAKVCDEAFSGNNHRLPRVDHRMDHRISSRIAREGEAA